MKYLCLKAKILGLKCLFVSPKPCPKVSTRNFSGGIKSTRNLLNPPEKISSGDQWVSLRRTWNMYLGIRVLARRLVLVELLKNRATWGILIALNEERICQCPGSSQWEPQKVALNCLPRSPAECKGHYPVGTLVLGSSGAAGSIHKWNFKQKTHKVTSSHENLDPWTAGKTWKSQIQTDYINSFGEPKQACLKEANIPSHGVCLGSEHRAT